MSRPAGAQDAEFDLDFSGTELTRTDTPVGEPVTVTLQDPVDAFVRTFTLVVPAIRLEMGDGVEFDTVAIETTDRSGAFVPGPGPSGRIRPGPQPAAAFTAVRRAPPDGVPHVTRGPVPQVRGECRLPHNDADTLDATTCVRRSPAVARV